MNLHHISQRRRRTWPFLFLFPPLIDFKGIPKKANNCEMETPFQIGTLIGPLFFFFLGQNLSRVLLVLGLFTSAPILTKKMMTQHPFPSISISSISISIHIVHLKRKAYTFFFLFFFSSMNFLVGDFFLFPIQPNVFKKYFEGKNKCKFSLVPNVLAYYYYLYFGKSS